MILSFKKIFFSPRKFKIDFIRRGVSYERNIGWGYGGACLEAKSSSTIIPILLVFVILIFKNILKIAKLLYLKLHTFILNKFQFS